MLTLTAMIRTIGTLPQKKMELPVKRKYFDPDTSGDNETSSANTAARQVKN
jgi:hypothetical protein